MKGKGWFGPLGQLLRHLHPPLPPLLHGADAPRLRPRRRRLPEHRRRRDPRPQLRLLEGFQKNPNHTDWCFEVLRHELEKAGYVDGDTLFGAPYDLRQRAAGARPEIRRLLRLLPQLSRLIEDASRSKNNQKVILFGHSLGGMVALEFVRSTAMAWREKYIKHLVLVAPVPGRRLREAGGVLRPPARPDLRPRRRTAGADIEADVEDLRVLHRQLPVPRCSDEASRWVITRERTTPPARWRSSSPPSGTPPRRAVHARAVPKMNYFEAPMVPTRASMASGTTRRSSSCIGTATSTAEPEIVYGDGDEDINLVSMVAFDEKMRRQMEQSGVFYKSIKIPGARHGTVITEDWALKRVMQEILKRIVSV
ncbi:hypothetical protein HU200_001186 [Digitaria exilis]|uniref:Uncharacterized protein n=1 Tax=Digitaria exilis TaxID=1010633 RepID=A0A835FXJ9_9POAL|nr:hypothetical protein HU200_001186 [Digitaria exilis]